MDLVQLALGWTLTGLGCGIIAAFAWLNQKVRP